MTVFIYALIDPRSDSVRYVGKAIDVAKRLTGHFGCQQNQHKSNWLEQLRIVGLKPKVIVLETLQNSNDLDWQERERFWIRHYREVGAPLTNIALGGESGQCHSEESKKKMAALATGRMHTEETKRKISRRKKETITDELRVKLSGVNLGRKQSAETKAKRSASMVGRIVSAETRAKIAAAHLGKTHSEETKAKLRAYRLKQIFTPEARAKHAAKMKGRRPSPQCMAASLAASKGRVVSDETRAKMRASRAAYFGRKKASYSEVPP